MDRRSNSPSYSSLFAILLIIAIMIIGANIGLETLVARRQSDHVIRIEGRRTIPEDVTAAEAAAYIEYILNTTESDRNILTDIWERLER